MNIVTVEGLTHRLNRPPPTFLLVPGLYDSDARHWQTQWQQRYDLPRVIQPDWGTPDIDVWARTLERYVDEQPQPVIILAHSFGCLATVFAAQNIRDKVRAALLVAPADPNTFGIAARLPIGALPFTSITVGSRNDPWMDFDWVQWWAQCWRSVFVDLGYAGHINTRSGFGDWPKGWELAQSLAESNEYNVSNRV